LINHHFGSKRELYLEVIRGALSAEQVPVPDYVHGETMEERMSRSLNGWFDVVESSPGVFLAAIRANGFADDEVARIAEHSREDIAAAFIQVLGLGPIDRLTPHELGTIRAWAGLGEAAVVQWIEYGRLTRAEVHDLTINTIVPGATQMLRARMGV
jgi:AcrR family transcriptional regulator